MQSLAEAAAKFGAALRKMPVEPVRAYRAAAQSLLTLTGQLAQAGQVTPEDYQRLADLVGALTRHHQDLIQSRTLPRRRK
jgi:hypothetical protein